MLYFVILDLFYLMIPSVSLHSSANAVFHNGSSYKDTRHGSCRLRSVREVVDRPYERSMTESFVLDDIEYKLCRYHVTWDEALVFCSNHKAHLATLDNYEKTSFVVQAIASSSSVSEDYWIGARKHYGNFWTWDSNSKGLSPEMLIANNMPILYPGDEISDAHCLTIDRSGHDVPILMPRACNQQRGFICQRDNERTFDNKIRMVAAARIGEQEFRLYAGRATWAEAVVQCRQEGLQIGEVNTVEEGQALAVSMLRNRPEGIESAWIGGYTRKNDPGTWRWLASGEKIENKEMWQKNVTEPSGGCLLLDRHFCEVPVYVETMCDRKRDVLCQKPPKKRLSRKPVAAIIDGCPYWIGFYPMKWSEARRSCESINASLVVLDSPKIISRMMSLMLDNRAELRHIWTDGRRTSKFGRWEWKVNGEAIPTSRESFIPWCPDDKSYYNGTDCLNLDRENLNGPLVYGLSCNEKQSYVCQPRMGECVSHSIASLARDTDIEGSETTIVKKIENLPSFYEDTNKNGVTGTMPMIDYNYGTVSAIVNSPRRYMDDSVHDWKPVDSVSSKVSTPRRNFSQYFKPLSRITLPTFPQFGIKVASASETTIKSLINFDTRRNKKVKQFSTTSSLVQKSGNLTASTISTILKKNTIDTRKQPSQIFLKKVNSSSSASINLGGYVESTTIGILRTTRTSKIIGPKYEAKNSTKNGKTATSIVPEYSFSSSSNLENGRTRKYSQKTTRDLYANLTQIITTTTKSPDSNYSSANKIKITKIANSNVPQNFRPEAKSAVENFSPNSLIRITTPLPMRHKKIRFTTEFTTPYDAVDEDYYDNYETRETTENDNERDSEFDEYDENYDTSENVESKKKIKQTSKSSIRKSSTTTRSFLKSKKTKKIGNNEKLSLPIAEELSKSLQIALMTMMKKGIDKKKLESTQEVVKTTSRLLPNDINVSSNKNTTIVKSLKMKNNTESWSLRPYYAFEGPMDVGLSEYTNFVKNSEQNEETGKSHKFKFTGKKMPDVSLKSEKLETRRYQENRRNNFDETLNIDKKIINNIPLGISGLPPIRPNDPNSLIQMGRYFKNKFGNIVGNGRNSEKISREESDEYTSNERNEKTRWPNGRYRTNQNRERLGKNRGYAINREEEFRRNGPRYDNSNYYESGRRLYPRGDYDFDTSILPRQRIKTNEKLWQERLSVSWPENNNSSGLRVMNLDEVVSERNFPAPIRTTRSFNEDSKISKIEPSKMASLPDFKISKLIKEVKIDLDQRLLRNYLEAVAKKITRKDNLRYRKDDWKDTWRYLLGQMSRILDRMNINVNGNVMKVRVGRDETSSFRKIDNLRKIEWMKKLRKQKKDFTNFAKSILRKKMIKMNGTKGENNSSNFMENRQITSDSFEKQLSKEINTKNSKNTKGYKIYSDENSMDSQRSNDVERNSLEREGKREKMLILKNPQTGSSSRYDEKTMIDSRKNFLERYRVTSRPLFNGKMDFHRLGDEKKMENWYRTKYTNFNNSRILAAPPAIIPSVAIPRIYSFQPMMQQLHQRLAFNQGFAQFRANPRINNVSEKSSILNGEYLPKGTLSRIVGSEYKNQHFPDKIGAKNNFFPFNNSSKEDNYSQDPSRNNVNATNYEKLKNKSNEWQLNFYDRDKLENRDFTYYANENETNYEKNDDDIQTEDENEEIDSSQDYPPKSIWSPSLRLGKAMELANLRKFRQNPMSYLPTKNLVTRSVKNDAISTKYKILRRNYRRTDNERGRDEIVRDLEYLKDEPSVVSLRMIMNPDKNNIATRKSRQSMDSSEIAKNPQTVELRLKFSGNEKKSRDSSYAEFIEDYRKKLANRTLNETNKLVGSIDRTKKLPVRMIDEIRRRAIMQKLREKSRKFNIKNYPLSWKRENASTIINSRDRKSRTVGIDKNGKNSIDEKEAKNYSGARQYLPGSLRNLEDKNLTTKRHFRNTEFDADWSGQEPSLFTDLRENNDQLTLYVDLKLGRVGTKLKRSGKSRT